MGARTNTKAVDFDKLEKQFTQRGLRPSGVARQIGRAPGYFGVMKKKGRLSVATIILLDTLLSIKYEDIEPMEEKPTPELDTENSEPVGNSASIELTSDELRYIITEAVKDAFTWYANL